MNQEQKQRVYSAIADPTRRHIVSMLAREPTAVQKLADHFSVSRPAISKHLRVLKQAKLVTERKVGRERVYSSNPAPLKEVQDWIGTFWAGKLRALKDMVE